MLEPARVIPPAERLGRLAFYAGFVRNPLEVMPQAVYESDFVAVDEKLRGVWITSPALVKAVLLDERDKFRKLTQIRLFSPLLGRGILTSEGAHWKWQRQAASPMFRPEELGAFVPAFVRATEDALARWRTMGDSVQAIDAAMTRVTFDVICATLLPSTDDKFAARFQRALDALQRFPAWDILYAALQLPPWSPRPGIVAKLFATRSMRAQVAALLREQSERRRAGGAPANDLMQRLIAARDPETGRAMDDEQLVDNLLTFYLAGHETTAKALTWTLYLLAHAPEWARVLEEEIARVTGGAPVGAEHVERLVAVQQVIKESMRLYPPVPIMSRQAVADATLDGHAIRPGTSVLIPIWAIHRHASRWENPDGFDPGRFAPEREAALARYQYMPFGAGPRVCIGRSFAMTEAVAILATLLRGARFVPVAGDEPAPVAGVTLIPKRGLRLKVTNRI